MRKIIKRIYQITMLAVLCAACGFAGDDDFAGDDEVTIPLPGDENFLISTNAVKVWTRSLGIGLPPGLATGFERTCAEGEEVFSQQSGKESYQLMQQFDCRFSGQALRGKVQTRSLLEGDDFESRADYSSLEGDGWSISGGERYFGQVSNRDKDISEWELSYDYRANLFITMTSGGETYSIWYKAESEEILNGDGFEILTMSEIIEVVGGNQTYRSAVDLPLVLNRSCGDDVLTFTQGTITGEFYNGYFSSSYSIDFGRGDCDNLITMTSSGNSVELKLDEELKLSLGN